MRFDAAQLGHFTDGEIALGWNRRQRFAASFIGFSARKGRELTSTFQSRH